MTAATTMRAVRKAAGGQVTAFIPFQAEREVFEHAGLSFPAISAILKFDDPPGPPLPELMDGPGWARAFIHREYTAEQFTYAAIGSPGQQVDDPRTGRPAGCVYSFASCSDRYGLTLFKLYGTGEELFCLVFAVVTSRVSQIIIPDMDCVIYDLDASCAEYAAEEFARHLPDIRAMRHAGFAPPTGRIGLVHLVDNYAHHLMNHLSGLTRLVEDGMAQNLDEIWITGANEFFGPTGEIIPELAGRIRYKDWRDVPSLLQDGRLEAFKIGSNVFTRALQARIFAQMEKKTALAQPAPPRYARHPLLVVTIRAETRRCLNLVPVIQSIVERLLEDFPNLGVIIDGWVVAEAAIVAGSAVVTSMVRWNSHLETVSKISADIAAALPAGVLCGNTIGLPILDSLVMLRDADAYFSHIGTLQHKLAWFSAMPGLVHGPRQELAGWQSGPYSSETGLAPHFMDAEAIEAAAPHHSSAPAREDDYVITDVSGAVAALKGMLRAARRR